MTVGWWCVYQLSYSVSRTHLVLAIVTRLCEHTPVELDECYKHTNYIVLNALAWRCVNWLIVRYVLIVCVHVWYTPRTLRSIFWSCGLNVMFCDPLCVNNLLPCTILDSWSLYMHVIIYCGIVRLFNRVLPNWISLVLAIFLWMYKWLETTTSRRPTLQTAYIPWVNCKVYQACRETDHSSKVTWTYLEWVKCSYLNPTPSWSRNIC